MMLFTDGTLSAAGVGVDRICPRTARAASAGSPRSGGAGRAGPAARRVVWGCGRPVTRACVGGIWSTDRHAPGVGRHLPRLPRRQRPHLPEPRLHRHRLARRDAGHAGTFRRDASSACPTGLAPATPPHSSNRSPSPCTTCGAAEVTRGETRRRDRRRADRRAHRAPSHATSAPRSSSSSSTPPARAVAGLGFTDARPARRRPVAWVDGVDRRRRRRRRLRGVGRGRRRARRHRPREGARHDRRRRHPPDARARSTCSGCSGGSSSILGARVYERSRLRARPSSSSPTRSSRRRAHHPDRAARRDAARRSPSSRRAGP